MICRLCLITLSEEDFTVHLYDNVGTLIEAHLVKIISTYFPQIQVTKEDPISTKVCEECSEQLEDFHRFFLLIEEKQKTLNTQSQYLDEDKSNVDIEYLQLPLPVEQQTIKFYEQTEPFEIQNIVLDALEKYECIDIEPAQIQESDALQEPMLAPPPSHCGSGGGDGGKTKDNNYSTDDDLPLIELIAKRKRDRRLQKQAKPPKKKETKKKTRKLVNVKRNADIIAEFMQLHCDLCKAVVSSYSELRGHFEQYHERNAYVRCCGKMFNKPGGLVEHIQWHRNPDIFKCDMCHKRLRSRNSLQVHKDLKHNSNFEDSIACPKCGKKFRGKKCLANHLQRHPQLDAKSFRCGHCEKSFATAQRLRCHVSAIHDNIYPHVCDICGKKFKFKPSFEKHILLHQGIVEPPQQCQLCGAWLKNKNALRLHRFRHEQDCQCKYCGRICVTRTALRGHIRYSHHMQSNHRCTYCDKTFKVAKNLQEHLAVHTGAQLYSCPHCSRQCRSKSNMYVHIKRAHFNEWMQSKMARSNDPSHSNVQAEKIRELEAS